MTKDGSAAMRTRSTVRAAARDEFRKGAAQAEPGLVHWLKAGYRPLRDGAMRWPAAVLGGAVLLFAGSLLLFPVLGSEFVPTLREGTFQVRSTLPPGASLDSAIQYGKRIQSVLREFPEVTGTYSRVGRAEVAEQDGGARAAGAGGRLGGQGQRRAGVKLRMPPGWPRKTTPVRIGSIGSTHGVKVRPSPARKNSM